MTNNRYNSVTVLVLASFCPPDKTRNGLLDSAKIEFTDSSSSCQLLVNLKILLITLFI